ncbi:MAG TPA: hypothetical protein VFY09_02380 [Flavobacteriaceae bacterium]|nr:hypothetical protein [Flavobacteriaceae bacterium]HEX5742729.1 hypothetical protein [Flavobacteriaceae bacterium]
MITILIIIVSIIAVAFIAYAVIKYVPLDKQWILSAFLWVAIAFLAFKIYDGIMSPINFNQEKEKRYKKVISNLKMIRDAEIAFYQAKGRYTDNEQELIAFVENGKHALTESRYIVQKKNLGGGIVVDVDVKITDTIGYEEVKNKFAGRDYKNMFNVPDTKEKFKVSLAMVEKVSGLMSPVFEAKVDKAIVLHGMDNYLVSQEKEAFGGEQVRGEFISVGSLEEVSTSGNWPPFYDAGDKKD